MSSIMQFNFDPAFEQFLVALDGQKTKLQQADQLDADMKKSFRDTPVLVQINPGAVLHRFCSQKNRPRFSNCWLDPKTMQGIMSSFRTGQVFSDRFKKEYIRNNLAILEDWSMLGYRVKIEVKKALIAHVGFVARQEVFKEVKDKEYLGNAPFALAQRGQKVEQLLERRKGGYVQIVIPRLKNKKLNQTNNDWGKVTHFTPI